MQRRTILGSMLVGSLTILGYRSLQFDRPRDRDALVIATPWPERLRVELERTYRLEESRRGRRRQPIEWLAIGAGEDMETITARSPRIDLLLGGQAAIYRELDQAGWFTAWPEGDPAASGRNSTWRVTRTRELGFRLRHELPGRMESELERGDPWEVVGDPRLRGHVDLADPRNRDQTDALLEAHLDSSEPWSSAYRNLVRSYANALPVPWRRSSSLDLLSTGSWITSGSLEAGSSLNASDELRWVPLRDSRGLPVLWSEGCALVRGDRPASRVEPFCRFMERWLELEDPEPSTPAVATQDRYRSLIRDLLGAVLVDAQPELHEAWQTLIRAGLPEDGLERLTAPPPWPPASIQATGSPNPDSSDSDRERLIRFVTRSTTVRAALLALWDRPPGRLDDAALRELATTRAGLLVGCSRFRAWLRTEWTTWASQNYRALTESFTDRAEPRWRSFTGSTLRSESSG